MLQIEDPQDLIVVMMALFEFRPKAMDRDLLPLNDCWDFMRDVTFYPLLGPKIIGAARFDLVSCVMREHGFDTTFDGFRVPGDREMSARSIKFTRRPA